MCRDPGNVVLLRAELQAIIDFELKILRRYQTPLDSRLIDVRVTSNQRPSLNSKHEQKAQFKNQETDNFGYFLRCPDDASSVRRKRDTIFFFFQ